MFASNAVENTLQFSEWCDHRFWASLGPQMQNEYGIEPINCRVVDRRRNRFNEPGAYESTS
jgi:hypothetical protein